MQLAESPYLDITGPDFSVSSETYRSVREASWFARTDIGYAILGYEDCSAMLRDPRLYQGSLHVLAIRGVTDGPLVEWWTSTMLNIDGAEHTRLRRLVAKAFTPPVVERLRPYFRATAQRLADAVPADGKCDFVSAFSEPYPLAGICEMLGIPEERRRAFDGWAADLGLIFSQYINDPDVRARAEAGLLGLYACVDDAVAARRADPRDDLVTLLIQAESEGDRLSEEELRHMLVGLVFAGNDTTRNQLALGAIVFAEHPEQWHLLGERPELAPRAVDEMMRVSPTIAMVPRIAAEDVTYRDVTFTKGTVLHVVVEAANVDACVYGEAPFDLTADRPSPHLSFSGGIHRCLGMWLARAEMEEALSVLATTFSVIERDGEPTWQPGLGIDGPTTLPLRLTRRSAA